MNERDRQNNLSADIFNHLAETYEFIADTYKIISESKPEAVNKKMRVHYIHSANKFNLRAGAFKRKAEDLQTSS